MSNYKTNHKIPLAVDAIRIAKSIFTLPESKRKPYMLFEIKPDSNGRSLYLKPLNEKEGKGRCAKLEKRGIYQSTVPFNITGETGDFRLERVTIDNEEYYKIGKRFLESIRK